MSQEQAKIHNNRGVAFLLEGRLDTARRELESALALDHENVSTLANLGYLLTQEGEFDQAILFCQKAIGLSPGYAVAYNNLALAYMEKDWPKKAEEAR